MSSPTPDDSARYWAATYDSNPPSTPPASHTTSAANGTEPVTERLPLAAPGTTSQPLSPNLGRALLALALGIIFIIVVGSARFGAASLLFLPLIAAWCANVYLGGRLNEPLTRLPARYRQYRGLESQAPQTTPPTPDAPPARPQGKRSRLNIDDENRPESQAVPPKPLPQVRSVSEALPSVRRLIDAALLFGFGILSCVMAGTGATDQTALAVLIGIGAIGYAGYVAFSRGSYVMPYWIYFLAVIGLIVSFFGHGSFA